MTTTTQYLAECIERGDAHETFLSVAVTDHNGTEQIEICTASGEEYVVSLAQ